VLHFLSLVRTAESGPGRGLAGVLEFLRALEEAEQDLGTAQSLPPTEDVVRLLSIHRSKGLEFPVVFVPDLGKQFNFQDAQGDVLVHRDRGLGLRVIDPDALLKYPTPLYRLLARSIHDDTRNEEMRVLYVAFTRAREHLVLSASCKFGKDLVSWAESPGEKLEPENLARAKRPVEWLAPVVLSHPDGEQLREAILQEDFEADGREPAVFTLRLHPGNEIVRLAESAEKRRITGAGERIPSAAKLLVGPTKAAAPETATAIEALERVYPCRESTEYPSRIQTTSLERFPAGMPVEAGERATFLPPWRESPRFLEEGGRVSPRERGGAVHRFLELVDLSGPKDGGEAGTGQLREAGLREQAQKLVRAGVLEENWLPLIPFGRLEWFFSETEPGRKLRERADEVLREVPFVLAVHGEDGPGKRPPEGETALVRGVIDCLVPDGQEYLLIDYKTDRVTKAGVEERAESYRPQMEVYREAVWSLFGKEVTGCFLVFLEPGVVKEAAGGWR